MAVIHNKCVIITSLWCFYSRSCFASSCVSCSSSASTCVDLLFFWVCASSSHYNSCHQACCGRQCPPAFFHISSTCFHPSFLFLLPSLISTPEVFLRERAQDVRFGFDRSWVDVAQIRVNLGQTRARCRQKYGPCFVQHRHYFGQLSIRCRPKLGLLWTLLGQTWFCSVLPQVWLCARPCCGTCQPM